MRFAPATSADPETLQRFGRDYIFTFKAMATPCEVRLETGDAGLAKAVGQVVAAEAFRIERKFSRYRDDSIVGRINASAGQPVEVDDETAQLLDFAAQCFEVSDGLFDITSGVLRKVWRFDGSDNVPDHAEIAPLLDWIGWQRLTWRPPFIVLPHGMELDLGGIAKEYAVDCALAAACTIASVPMLVNFGGDLRVSGRRSDGTSWLVAIESVEEAGRAAALLDVSSGAIATSGDARRYLLKSGVRYSHILNPRTGWPVMGAPRSITVAAHSCVEAGLIATLAMLQGESAEAFLRREGMRAWCVH